MLSTASAINATLHGTARVSYSIACVAAFGALVWQTARTGPSRLWVLAAMVALAVLIEGSFRLAKREIRLHE
jgi:hypothetical protein